MDEFRELDGAVQVRLLRLMARISEASYRRGYQHGTHFAPKGKVMAERIATARFAHDLHMERSMPGSNNRRGKHAGSSQDRLAMEYFALHQLFEPPIGDIF